jgi:hypothetical protein
MEKNFIRELSGLINSQSLENCSNTQDFVLAEFLNDCMQAFNKAVNRRDNLKNGVAVDCRPETTEELMASRDHWKQLAHDRQREVNKWRHARDEYKKALEKCADSLIKSIEATANQTRKLQRVNDELTDLKMQRLEEEHPTPIEPEADGIKSTRNIFNAVGDAIRKVIGIIDEGKMREAKAFKEMAKRPDISGNDEEMDQALRAAEKLGTTAPGYAHGGFVWEPRKGQDDNAAPEYYGKPRPPFPEDKKPRK